MQESLRHVVERAEAHSRAWDTHKCVHPHVPCFPGGSNSWCDSCVSGWFNESISLIEDVTRAASRAGVELPRSGAYHFIRGAELAALDPDTRRVWAVLRELDPIPF